MILKNLIYAFQIINLIWQRIIFENFIDKNCIQVGLTLDATLIPLNNFKQLMNGEDVMNIVKNLHKLRQDKILKEKNHIS